MNSRTPSIAAALLLALILQAPASGQAPAAKKQPVPSIAPDLANVPYGPHERNVLDLWKAKVEGPAPLVVFVHGGGFTAGDKGQISSLLLEGCLKNGISVAAINYRYSTQAPYPAPMADSARAVQFLRLHAREYGLNLDAFAATGGSAGAGISLWIGFHDDMADARSDDPVKRQSTRLCAMGVNNGQTTYDPRAVARLITPEIGRIGALRTLFGVKQGEDPLEASEYFKLYEDGSPVTHLTRDDPPVFLYYSQSNTPMPPESQGVGIHHPRFGYFLKEKMDKLEIECIVRVKDDYEGKPPGQWQRDEIEFFLKHFPKH